LPASPDERGLAVAGLRVDAVAAGVDIVDEVGFSVAPGSALGIVGESGSGKTTVALALLGYARPGTRVVSGGVRVDGLDMLALDEERLRSARGRLISFVPQNPATALAPSMRVGRQVEEMLELHRPGSDATAMLKAAWEGAQLPHDEEFLRRYPHQLSGGQQQRVSIAMALACEPSVVVMDEPTTGLDVITQARLLDVIRDLRSSRDAIIVYVSHDLGVVRNLVDRVAVMYGGRLVEEAQVDDLFRRPQHPYTQRLLEAVPRVRRTTTRLRGIAGSAVEPWNRPAGCPFAPRCGYRVARCDSAMPAPEPVPGAAHVVRCWRTDDVRAATLRRSAGEPSPAIALPGSAPPPSDGPLLEVRDLWATYKQRRGSGGAVRVNAVAGVSFDVAAGACLAVVGESGSGKTTLARCLAGLHAPLSGAIRFAGQPLAPLARRRDLAVRRRLQIVFQNPEASLNPTMTVGAIVRRPLRQFFSLGRAEEQQRVADLLERVRLPAEIAARMPRELSGGQQQRVSIARALAAEPDLLICDEVTSALDVSVQANLLELLAGIRASLAMAMVFISHDLAVVRSISDDVVVMRAGEIREAGPRDDLFGRPGDGYTRQLLLASPDLRDEDYPAALDAAASG
jgi:peptide/nickel transport system ATP-binding protein